MPSLSDTAGAVPVLPTASELTAETTRPASVDVHAPTVRSGVDQALLPAPTVQETVPPRARPSLIPWLVAAVVLIAVGILLWRRTPTPAPKPAPPPVVVARARLGINAFPWGQVMGIRNVASGENVALRGPVVTPAPIELAPGTYEITLTNPKYPQPLRRTVSLRPGEEQDINVAFVDPSSVSLPRFDGAAR